MIYLSLFTSHLRILEFADPPKLLALDASWKVRIALDLLFPAGHASNGEPLSWLSSLGDSPMGVDSLAVNDSLAMGSIVVEIAKAFTRNFRRTYESWEEMRSGPNLRAQTILGSNDLGDRCADWCGWRVVGS